MESRFEIQLLGPPQLRWRERPFTLPRRQVRALLFRLAAESQPEPREKLADLLWSETPPARARRNLTRLLSYLRQQLPHPDLLQTNSTAVFLNYNMVRSDAVFFADLCLSDDPGAWQSAVSLYRGPFLSGFVLDESREFESWQSQMGRHFEELYLKTLRRLVLGGPGGPAQAISYAGLYLAVDDLAEDIHRQLITLYGQTGDRAAALRQYEECVFVLERELGVEPLPETRAAYEAVRDGRLPTVPEKAPKPQWTTLPGLDLSLTGREEAWRELAYAYNRLSSGGVIFISGEAGVGKSRLMQEFATRSEALVLSGNNQAESSAVPYQPLIQALRQALASLSRWAQILPIWLAELSRLMPELPDHFPGLPPPLNVEPQQAQARVFEAFWQVFSALAGASPLLLCLDDIHWADESTRGWLGYAAGRLSGSSLCIMATFRTQQRTVLQEMQRSLQRSGLMAEVALGGLSQTAVASLLQQSNGEATEAKALAAQIHKATGGNAFFVLETIRELLETDWANKLPADLPLPATVREAVLRRTARLSPLAQQILEITAVLSPSLTFPTIRETSGRDELQTAEGLEELVAHQILLADRERFVFHHGLARDAIYQTISDWRRRLLHRRAAAALAPYTAGDNEQISMIGAHYESAGDFLPAIDTYRQAAAAASNVFAFKEAVLNLQQAINLAAELPGTADLLPGLYELLADNLAAGGEFLKAEAAYRTALETTGDSSPLHLAELERKLAATLPPQQRENEAETAYRAALARLDGVPESRQLQTMRLNILLALLNVLYLRMRPEAMAPLEEEIVALLDEVGTAEQQSRYYSRLCQEALLHSRFRVTKEIIAHINTSLRYAQESGNERWLCGMRFNKAFVTLLYGHPDSARNMLPQVLETAEEQGNAFVTAQCLAYLAVADRLLGNRAQVAAWLPRLEDVCRRIGYRVYMGVARANAAWLHYRAAEWQQAEAAIAQALQSWGDNAYPFRWQAYWILLVLALRDNNLADGAGAARTMLDHKQQKLPDEMDRALATAMAAWDAGEKIAARDYLQTAVGLAAQHGYL